MKKNKINILSTARLDATLLKKASRKNIEIDIKTFIATQTILNSSLRKQVKTVMDKSSTVVFTSMNAVEAIKTILGDQMPQWKIYSIGSTTGKLIKKYFVESEMAGTANNAASLAKKIVEDKVADLTFFCGDLRRDDLPLILNKEGVALKEIIVYRTLSLPHKVNKNYEGILFFSPSAVNIFFKTNEIAAETKLFAIGSTTADEIKQHTQNEVILSIEPGKQNLVNRMIEHFT